MTKQAKTVAKLINTNSKYTIDTWIDKCMTIWIDGTNTLITYEITSDESKNGVIEEDEWEDNIHRKIFKYSKNPVDEWKMIYKYLSELFNKKSMKVLRFTIDALVDQNISTIDFLKANLKSVDECVLFGSDGDKHVNGHVAYFVDNIKINDTLELILENKNDNFDGKTPKNLQELYISDSGWIKYKNLLEMDSKNVTLSSSRISNEDWNLFLKKWIAMETNLNLEYLQFDYSGLIEFRDLVLYDIPREVVDREVKRNLKIGRNTTKEISGGVDIKRIDGKTATFFVSWIGSLAMSIH